MKKSMKSDGLFLFLSSVYRKKLNFCVRRVIRDATSIFIFCQTHVSIFSPSIAPPILQDPLGWRISNDQHGVIHHVRTTNFVIVDPFAVNQNHVKKFRDDEKGWEKKGIEREGKIANASHTIRWWTERLKYRGSRRIRKLPFSSETQVHWLSVRCRFRLIIA